ncbi:hypothetical protein GCM10009069_29180 [Algimonas arctica]|uniref:AAA family ATPase n=1 Tax=Algimonas arctica TaxID=1479486 RepID=A0A8J3G3I8_9PROT|nr:AAA family ATPase [Algimonas arctica]GHB04765.1 hypothetical protein GCM10009069_29180 [Algimonas arctica]
MRLKSVRIQGYKNLSDLTITFDGPEFIDILVGKNGSGKSNFLEAIVEAFDHLYNLKKHISPPTFSYHISWEIAGVEYDVSWDGIELRPSKGGKTLKTLRTFQLPDNIIIYYSGQNETITDLIRRYRNAYRRSAGRKSVASLPNFIGIGPDYKSTLLAQMLMLPEDNPARQILCKKLDIQEIMETATLVLRRPSNVAKKKYFDPFEEDNAYWGAKGVTFDFLEKLKGCILSFDTLGSLYDREADQYNLPINIEKFRQVFADTTDDDVFCLFNTLRAFDMIEDIYIPIRLAHAAEVSSKAFSDGQFQSVYLFAISELFKSRECLTLLDEPDSFLHPEWQFEFLEQMKQISDQAACSNHFLMSTHSASTIAANVETRLRVLERGDDGVVASERDKSEVITDLSAGLITFTEDELRLDIEQVILHHDSPILFTEGPTDRLILKTAWAKLFPDENMPFVIESGNGCKFLRFLFKDETFKEAHHGRTLFALFDFDKAYDDWFQFGTLMQEDLAAGLVKRRENSQHYGMLLPVPDIEIVRRQVINDAGDHYGNQSLMTIEHLFYACPEVKGRFRQVMNRQGNLIEFTAAAGRKREFAEVTIPTIDRLYFEPLRPIFDFISDTISP